MDDSSEEYWLSEEDYSESYESKGKLRSIWRKGLSLGKKMVVTGIVVSSAPFVLPPLVAISALGVAFSVPAGFACATYACTEKLLNTFLPVSTPYPLSEDEKFYTDDGDDYDEVDRFDVDEGYEEDDDIEAEEKEFEEDTRKGLEMRIELVDETDDGKDDYGQIPIDKDEFDVRNKTVNENVKEVGYEGDINEYAEDDEERVNSNVIEEILEGIREAENELSLMEGEKDEMPINSVQAVVVAAEVGGVNENNVEEMVEEVAFVPQKHVKEENGHKVKFGDIEQDELREETTGLIEQMRDEGKDDDKSQHNAVKETPEEIEVNREIPVQDVTKDEVNRDLFVIPEEVKPSGVINGAERSENSNNISIAGAGEINQEASERRRKEEEGGFVQEEPKPVVEERLVVHVKTSGDRTVTDVHKETSSDTKTGTLVVPIVDSREYESGFDLFDHGTVEPDQTADSINQRRPEEEKLSTSKVVDEKVDYHEAAIESTVPVTKHVHAETAMDKQTTAGSDKGSLEEEKIWEQIHAMRTIVGYKVAPHSSYVEELKALYVFTGVEPPVPSKGTSDLANISENLQFLMSVIGVK